MNKTSQTRRAIVLSIPAAVALRAAAQGTFPDRPIRLLAGVPAGQSSDVLARLIVAKVSEYLKQSVVVDNRPGAGGIIALEAAKAAAPDGYTLVSATSANMAINPALYRKLPYDPVADYEPVVGLVSSPLFLFTSPATPINSARELAAYVKARPGQVSYGSAGNGGTQHIAMEMLKKAGNLDITHVPYKGAPPVITDVIGRQVHFAFDALPAILPLARAGQVKLLGISSAQRSPQAPDVPTIAEQGYPGYSAVAWQALFAPRGTPPAVIEILNSAFNRALKDPQIAVDIVGRGAQPMGGTVADLKSFVQTEISRWGDAVRRSGASVD